MSPMNNRRMVPMAEPGILDFAPGAAAAYSLRNLSLSYVGPVVTVRRSTDDAEADFTAAEVRDGTLVAWCSGGDGFVKTWHDQSQHGRDASQGTSGYQPQIVDAGTLVTEGGKAAVRFTASDSTRLSFGDIATDSAISTFTVTRRQAAGLRGVVLSSATVGGGTISAYEFSDNKTYVGNRTSYIYAGSALSEQVLYSSFSPDYLSAAGMALYRNGALLATTTGVLASSVPINSIGKRAGEYATGTAQELLIYPSDMTSLRTRIEGNLAWYY